MIKKFLPIIIFSFATLNVSAATLDIWIGADDGFGGTQGSNSDPGDSYNNLANTNTPIAPGSYANLAAINSPTESPWFVYDFTFDFAYDTTGLSSITSAIIEIQHGSLSNRSGSFTGVGFGNAGVSATTVGPSVDLGIFLSTDTGSQASALEESVKLSTFDVTSLIGTGGIGVLSLFIDGSTIGSNPVDLFAIDFAKLTITDDVSAIPLPGAVWLFGTALVSLAGFGTRRRKI